MNGFIPAESCEYPFEYLPSSAMTPKIGMALAFNASGQLEASATPQFICLQAGAALSAGDPLCVLRISKDMKFEAPLDDDTSFKEGQIAQLASDGMTVDADGDTGGVFLITEFLGKEDGDHVRGYFVEPKAVEDAGSGGGSSPEAG